MPETVTNKADVWRIVTDVGVTIGVGLDIDMSIAYVGSFGEPTMEHGGSLSFKFNKLNTELTMKYSNTFDGSKPNSGNYNALFGVTIRY